MCLPGGVKAPYQPQTPTAVPEGTLLADSQRRLQAGAGLASTILTGPQGAAMPASQQPKTLIGG